jgi:hypothetical protein
VYVRRTLLTYLLSSVDKNHYCRLLTLIFGTWEKRFKELLLQTSDEKAGDCLLRQERERELQCDSVAKFSLNLTVLRPT